MRRMINRYQVLFAVFGVVVVSALWLADFPVGLSTEAQQLFEECSQADNASHCYEVEVPGLYPEKSIDEIFSIIRTIRTIDPNYQFCHVLGHQLGERVVAEDPARWINAIPMNPSDGLCSNGFIHGVVGGRFRAEVLDDVTLERLTPDFSRACEPRPGWKPSLLDQAICNHGMGHLYMFITDADIPKALSLCEDTTYREKPYKDFRRVCREGVFMQIYQPLEPDDFLLIERMPVKPTKETVRWFCARYERDEYEGACLRESWPFFREEIEGGFGIGDFCSGQPNAREETACYESAFSILGRMSLGDPDNILSACSSVPAEREEMCYEYGAQTVLEENREDSGRAISLCERAPEENRMPCIESLVSKVVFNFGKSEYAKAFCDALPETLKESCLSRIR